MNIILYDRFTDALEKSGMTRTELAEKVGVKPSEVTRFFKDGSNPTLATVEKFARALGVAPYDAPYDYRVDQDLEYTVLDLNEKFSDFTDFIAGKVADYFDEPTEAKRSDIERHLGISPALLARSAHEQRYLQGEIA